LIFEFVIRDWAAWASTLDQRARWLAWAADAAPACPAATEAAPALADMPAMSRRRLNPLGRMAAQMAYDIAPSAEGAGADGCPMIFASRYGDASRSLALLGDLVRGEPVSPTAFGLSVHNAIGAMVSIARGDRSHHTALAGGQATAGMAIVEAAGLLADGVPEVIVVNYDTPLPGDYAAFSDEPRAAYAWAWRLARPRRGEPRLRLQLAPAEPQAELAESAGDTLPFGLGLLRFGLSSAPAWQRRAEGQAWRWSRHE
jgi:Beta-ketoacyl synthase, N-terminal domain